MAPSPRLRCALMLAMAKSFFDDPNIEAWKALSPKDAAHRLIELCKKSRAMRWPIRRSNLKIKRRLR